MKFKDVKSMIDGNVGFIVAYAANQSVCDGSPEPWDYFSMYSTDIEFDNKKATQGCFRVISDEHVDDIRSCIPEGSTLSGYPRDWDNLFAENEKGARIIRLANNIGVIVPDAWF